MKAYQLTAWQAPPEMREVPVPEPGPGQVLVKVGGAGACHSDLHLMEWPEGTMEFDLPFTLGHENAGWVEALGAGVEGLEPGEAVAVYGPWGCGRCRACRRSAENYCERQAEIGAFGGGLGFLGAALLAAAIVPLSTAYSVSETLGRKADISDTFEEARSFYVSYGIVVIVAAVFVLIPAPR